MPDAVASRAGTGRGRHPLTRLVEPASVAVVLLGLCAVLVRTGATAGQALAVVAGIVLTQVLPGVVVWRLVRPVRGWWAEDLAIGFAIGTVLAAAAQAVAGAFGVRWLSAALPPALALLALAVPALRGRVVAARAEALPVGWTALVAVWSLAFTTHTVTELRRLPLQWDGFARHFVDSPFHLALAGELAHRGPAATPYVVGEPLAYHWGSHAWVAQVATAGGVPLDLVLVRVLPLVFVIAVPFVAAAAAVRLAGTAWAGPVGAALACLAAGTPVLGFRAWSSPVLHSSPSLAVSVVVALALLALLASRLAGTARTGAGVLVLVLGLGAAVMKGSALPPVVAGLAAAAAVALVARSPHRRLLLTDLGLLTGALVLAYLAVFRGGSGGLALAQQPFLEGRLGGALAAAAGLSGLGASAAVGLLVVTTTLALAAGVVGLAVAAGRWHEPVAWIGAGTLLAGVCAAGLFEQPGRSEVYFLLDAAPLAGAASGAGLAALAARLRRGPSIVAVASGGAAAVVVALLLPRLTGTPTEIGVGVVARAWVAMALATALVALAALVAAALVRRRGRGAPLAALLAALVALVAAGPVSTLARIAEQRPLPGYGPSVPSTQVSFSADQVEAARWLREHSDRLDLVAANRHCTRPVAPVAQPQGDCDARRFFVSGYTERRVLVEGWSYTPTNAARGGGNSGGPFWDQELLALNDRFFTEPDEAGARALAERGVRWLFVDRTAPHAPTLEPFARLRYETEWAQVYELPSS